MNKLRREKIWRMAKINDNIKSAFKGMIIT
jgi:hypothetical protein